MAMWNHRSSAPVWLSACSVIWFGLIDIIVRACSIVWSRVVLLAKLLNNELFSRVHATQQTAFSVHLMVSRSVTFYFWAAAPKG